MTLNEKMQFDHVVEVLSNGSVVDRNDIFAPELFGVEEGKEKVDGWELLDGYSGQYNYSGPIMHNSEFIGGRMERDILETPGVYVALVCYWPDDEDSDENETYAEGWAVARMVEENA